MKAAPAPSSRLVIHLIYPTLPPRLDGIGDYTANLARELALRQNIHILTAQDSACDPIEGVTIEPCFRVSQPASVRQLEPRLLKARPDWILLQYNPFSYGKRGWNPFLPLVIRRVRRQLPATRFALMVHEPFMPAINFKMALMTSYQRWQLWMLGRSADVIFFSIDPWVRRFGKWFPSKPVLHLPVGSNIPNVGLSREHARAELKLDEQMVLGVFGTARDPRMLNWIRGAAQAVKEAGLKPLVLYVGPHREAMQEALGDVPLRAEGVLPAEMVSRRLSAMDIYLAPFIDGASTRRTSLMTGLQHGLATVTTQGPLTDDLLKSWRDRAFLMADAHSEDAFRAQVARAVRDDDLRARLGREAERLFEQEFAWGVIAARLLKALSHA